MKVIEQQTSHTPIHAHKTVAQSQTRGSSNPLAASYSLWVLVRTNGNRLKMLNGKTTPVFDFPAQAYKFAQALGINEEYYSIIKLKEKTK